MLVEGKMRREDMKVGQVKAGKTGRWFNENKGGGEGREKRKEREREKKYYLLSALGRIPLSAESITQ